MTSELKSEPDYTGVLVDLSRFIIDAIEDNEGVPTHLVAMAAACKIVARFPDIGTRHPAPLSEENVEVVARALWARLYDDPPLKWPGLTHPDAECIVEDARAAITALTTQESNRE